jgi:hypothetical protein
MNQAIISKPEGITFNESTGRFFRYLTYHLKAIEHRLDWSTAFHKFHGNNKQIINQSVNRVQIGLRTVIGMLPTSQVKTALTTELNNDQRLADFMMLNELLLDFPDEDFQEIVDVIETHLKKKADGVPA